MFSSRCLSELTIYHRLLITSSVLFIHAICINRITNAFETSDFTYTPDPGFPIGKGTFGQIVAVDVDDHDNVMIFHRGSTTWEEDTFGINGYYLGDRSSPIPEPTVVTIDFKQNRWINPWGNGTFYMPHGLTISRDRNHVWLTDVALHQVFKYTIDGSHKVLELGVRFESGNDDRHFCQPTSVADTGQYFFVADGYCNSRIAMFTESGIFVGQFGRTTSRLHQISPREPDFLVPHKVIYSPETKILCVADRENGRIQCFKFESKSQQGHSGNHYMDDRRYLINRAITAHQTITNEEFHGKLFSIAYNPIQGGLLVAVSGTSIIGDPAVGFVYNMSTGQLLSRFEPASGRRFQMAHDLALTHDEARSIYVAEASPVNLWRFSRRIFEPPKPQFISLNISRSDEKKDTKTNYSSLISDDSEKRNISYGHISLILYGLIMFLAFVTLLVLKRRRVCNNKYRNTQGLLPSLHNNRYSNSISLFGARHSHRRLVSQDSSSNRPAFSRTRAVLSRNLFSRLFRVQKRGNNEFSRLPFEESDRSGEEDLSDSDVEEFNINETTTDNVDVKV